MWEKIDRETLPRLEGGVNWGTPRDVILRKGDVCLVKTRGQPGDGHAPFQRGYLSPCWYIRTAPRNDGHHELDLPEGSRVTLEIWKRWMGRVATVMGLSARDMPAKPPRGCTLVWGVATPVSRTERRKG